MTPVAIGLAAFALWLIWTGRLKRMTGMDGAMLGIAIVGAVIAAKGRLWLGGPLLGLSAWHFFFQRPRVARAQSSTYSPKTLEAERVDIAEAKALLGLPDDYDEADIQEAHRRLMTRVHPDAGGTNALAQKINDARALLLRHHFERKRS